VDANERRYFKEFLPAMLAYAVVMIISVWLIKHQVHPELKIPFALLPMIPALFAMWAAIRYFRGLDELQRRIQFEGLAFSFVASCLIALTWGFLQNAGLPHADIAWVAPLLVFLWGVGACVAKRRYQ
jgi:O-antigen/teichoic acid export membrane protein